MAKQLTHFTYHSVDSSDVQQGLGLRKDPKTGKYVFVRAAYIETENGQYQAAQLAIGDVSEENGELVVKDPKGYMVPHFTETTE